MIADRRRNLRRAQPVLRVAAGSVVEASEMAAVRAHEFSRRYSLILLLGALAFSVLIAGLVTYHFRAERSAQLDALSRTLFEHRLTLDASIKSASDHVHQMRTWAEGYLAVEQLSEPSPLRRHLIHAVRPAGPNDVVDGVFLDQLRPADWHDMIGNVLGTPQMLARSGADAAEVDLALGLFPQMRAAQMVTPYLRWSYYFSGQEDFIAIAPFRPSHTFIEDLGFSSMPAVVESWFTYDVFQQATPERDPARQAYWTDVYADAAGAGWMVSHAAPVYQGERFVGMVGTDILLEFLDGLLANVAYPGGSLWIVNDKGQILARSDGGSIEGDDVPLLGDVLSAELTGVDLQDLLGATGQPRELAGHYVLTERLVNAPWTLLYVVPVGLLNGQILPRLLPYGVILAALLLTLAIAQMVLQRLFVRPAIALVEHIKAEGAGASAPRPRLPAAWQPSLAAVAEAFSTNRAMALRLREEHLVRSAIVTASLDALITVDDQGHIIEFNPYAERTFGHQRDAVLGRKVGELIVPPALRGAHEAGMRRYLETGDKRLIGRRIETEAIDATGRTFPIEIAIAEIGLAERRLFTAFIRDISERNRADAALRASEERYRAVIEAQTDLILRQRPDGKTTFVNDAYCRYMGMTRERILGPDWDDLSVLSASERARYMRMREGLTPAHPIATIEVEATLLDGAVRWEQWVEQALFDQDGQVVEYQSVGRDISELKFAEQELRESEERFREIAESVPLPIVITRTDETELLFCNARAATTFGVAVGMRGAQLRALWVDPEDRKRLLAKIARRGRMHGFEVELRRADATPFWALISAHGMQYGGTPAMLIAVTDISERKAMERSLRASEARLAAFMRHAPVGMYLKDRDGRYLLANPEMAKVFGRPVEEVLGKLPADVFAPADAAMIASHDRDVVKRGVPTVQEEYLAALDVYAWSLVIRFPIRDHGRITHIGGFDVDITLQKRIEQQLEASRQHFRAVAEANPVAMAIVRLPERRLVFANAPYLGMFRIAPADLDGFSPASLFVDPTDAERVLEPADHAGRLDGFEVQLKRTDGNVFPAMLTHQVIQYDGSAAAVTSVLDLTDKKEAEAQIERQREALYQQEKLTALGSLLAGVAHELNNPLAVVLGQATMLLDDPEDDDRTGRLQKIYDAAERCARIVKTFLAMARQRPPQHAAVDLNQLAQVAVELLAYTLRTTDVEVELRLEPDLPWLAADRDQLSQVLLNLLLNAQQALQDVAPPRRVRIATSFDPDEGMAVIEVADDGPGVPHEIRPRIFEPFYTTKPLGVGTGIGLSVCRGMVEAHGGTITVGDSPEGGALFTVRLPSRRVPTADVEPTVPASAEPMRRAVLIVDDEAEVAQMAADMLRLEGHEVAIASSGRQALGQLAERSFDVILCDVRMPDLDGPALYRALGELRPQLQGRMVFFTGDLLSTSINRFLEETGRPCLDKPFLPSELKRTVESVIEAGVRSDIM